MTFQKQMVLACGLTLGLAVFAGCGGAREVGPADPSQVPVVDPAAIQKEINRDEGKKYLPKGFKGPPGMTPASQPSKPAEQPSK